MATKFTADYAVSTAMEHTRFKVKMPKLIHIMTPYTLVDVCYKVPVRRSEWVQV